MTTPTKFFHDRSVLLLLALNSILVITGILLVLFQLDSTKGNTYYIQFRGVSASGEFKTGNAYDMSSFIMFFVISFGISLLISTRIYHERRNLAISTLMMMSVLAVFAIVVSGSLLAQR
jgi:hypothetical membrane protein